MDLPSGSSVIFQISSNGYYSRTPAITVAGDRPAGSDIEDASDGSGDGGAAAPLYGSYTWLVLRKYYKKLTFDGYVLIEIYSLLIYVIVS